MEELLVLFFRAEPHHPLDAGAVVPAAVEQDDFSAGGKMRHVALEVPLATFAFARSRQRRDPADARIEALRDPFDDPALSRRVAPLEDDHDLELLPHDPVLQLHQLALQAKQLLEVDATIDRLRLRMLGDLGQQLGQAIVVDLHLEFFVDGIAHSRRWSWLEPGIWHWFRPVTFDAHDDCVTLPLVRRETRDRGADPAVSLTSECGFRTNRASRRSYSGLRTARNGAV